MGKRQNRKIQGRNKMEDMGLSGEIKNNFAKISPK
jgi:hypothetical protein